MRLRILAVMMLLGGMAASGAENDASKEYDDTLSLKEVEVLSSQKFGASSAQMSAVEVSGELIKVTPAIFGEHDVLKTLQQMPGVTQVGDGRAALYVRGGDYDQNLIMIDGIPFYNSEHMAGFMSAMNPDMVDKADLYTGAFPSRFGGRLSSIVDISLLDGDNRHFKASASVGMLSSRLNVQGPIVQGKSSFNFGARVSYFDAIVKPIFKKIDKSGEGLRPYSNIDFYDFTLKTNFNLSEKAKLSVTAYYSHDVYDSAPSDTKSMRGERGKRINVKATVTPLPDKDGWFGVFSEPVDFKVVRNTRTYTERAITSATESNWSTLLASARLDYDLGRGYSMDLTAATSMLWYKLDMIQNQYTKSTNCRMLPSWELVTIYGPIGDYGGEQYVEKEYSDQNFLSKFESKTWERQRYHSDVIDASLGASFGKTAGTHVLRWGLLAKSMRFNPRVDINRKADNTASVLENQDEEWETSNTDKFPNEDDFERYSTLVSVPTYIDSRMVIDSDSTVGGVQRLQSVDVYAEDDWTIANVLKVNYGLRLATNIVRGKTYANIEPRISAAYMLASGKGAVKASLSMMSQGVHYLYSSNLLVMSGIWVPSTKKIAPTTSMIAAGGICWELPRGFYVSAEGYYKTMDNLLEYSEGVSYFQAPGDWQAMTVTGRGWAYGADLLISKNIGKFTGLLRYSWSKSLRRFDRPGQELNLGRTFYAPNDRRNVANLMLVYSPNSHWTLSATWNYMTGRNATIATHTFYGGFLDSFDKYTDFSALFSSNSNYTNEEGLRRYMSTYMMTLLQYSTTSGRNRMRLPANHRLDVSIDYSFRTGRLGHTVNLSICNLYNHKNWSRVYIVAGEKGRLKIRGLCNFPFMPSITYTIRF